MTTDGPEVPDEPAVDLPPVQDPATPEPYPEPLEGRDARTDQDPDATYEPEAT